MTFFELLLALLLAAILLLQVSRRLKVPYPTMLAAAGVGVALIPGVPAITIAPQTALALFVAPALLDAAYDFPMGAVRRLWRPLVALAVVAVLLSALVAAGIGWWMAGLPPIAALALGAIVAPPDAAAASAVLSGVSVPRRTEAVLKGESLLNDATTLLLFEAAVTVQGHGGTLSAMEAVKLALAVPGGVLLGLLLAAIYKRLSRFVAGTLGGNLLEFVSTFWIWILPARAGLSAVLCVVAFAMSIARSAGLRQSPLARVHSYAVWETVVFLLNVVAFLLMGMQARVILGGMQPDRLREAAGVAGMVVAGVIVTRLCWSLAYNRLAARLPALHGPLQPASARQGILVGWAGMRGLVTLATAFALPPDFPQRDLIVLTAFATVLATLVIQGLTLGPLIRLLGVEEDGSLGDELTTARRALAECALERLSREEGSEVETIRRTYRAKRAAEEEEGARNALVRRRTLRLAAIRAERERLQDMRRAHEVQQDAFETLQQELDFAELALVSEDERHLEEN